MSIESGASGALSVCPPYLRACGGTRKCATCATEKSLTTDQPSLTAAAPPRRCRACAMTADRCPTCNHKWSDAA